TRAQRRRGSNADEHLSQPHPISCGTVTSATLWHDDGDARRRWRVSFAVALVLHVAPLLFAGWLLARVVPAVVPPAVPITIESPPKAAVARRPPPPRILDLLAPRHPIKAPPPPTHEEVKVPMPPPRRAVTPPPVKRVANAALPVTVPKPEQHQPA